MNLSLIDQALFAFVNEFNRILNGQDVLIPIGIDVIHHGRKRRAFPGARWSSHCDEAPRGLCDLTEDLAHSQLIHCEYLRRNRSEYCS